MSGTLCCCGDPVNRCVGGPSSASMHFSGRNSGASVGRGGSPSFSMPIVASSAPGNPLGPRKGVLLGPPNQASGSLRL